MNPGVEYINPAGAPPAQGLYSHCTRVKAGEQIFIAGQLAVGDDGSLVGAHDFEKQFHRVFENLGSVLKGVGLDFNDVAKFTTHLVHSQDIEKFMPLRAALFPKLFKGNVYPPNTLLVVDRLVKENFLIEVEVVARARD